MKFHENLTSGNHFLPCRWTVRHGEAKWCLSQISECAYKVQYIYIYNYTWWPKKTGWSKL